MAQNDERKDGPPTPPSARLSEGGDLGRILALSDGVFAFAMTLLVINLAVPTAATLDSLAPNQPTGAQLVQYLRGEEVAFLAYGLAFFIVGNWWSAHHRLFRLLYRYDGRLMSMNLVFLLFIAVTPFDVGLLARYGDTSVGVAFYALAQTLAGLVLVYLWTYVKGTGRPLVKPEVPSSTLREGTLLATLAPAWFGLSVPVAFVSPYAAFIFWIGIFIARFIVRRSSRFASVRAPD